MSFSEEELSRIFNQVKKQADDLGLEGPEKAKYIKEESHALRQELADIAREERAAQREIDKAKEEREAQERREQSQRDHEFRMASLPPPGNGSTTSSQEDAGIVDPFRRRPFSAPFKEDVPLDVYLRNYDAVCDTFEVSEVRRLQDLYVLLPQKLLQVLNELDSTVRKDYERVKEALLQATNFSADDCRERYFTAFPKPEESMLNFVQRKERLLDDWLRLSKVPDDRQKLKEFFIWDTIQASLPVDMASHLRVYLKGEVDLKKTAEEADQFLRHSRPGKRLPDILKKPARNGTHEQQKRSAVPNESQPSPSQQKHRHQKNGNKSHHHSKQSPVESSGNKSATALTKTGHSAAQQQPQQSSHGGSYKPVASAGNRYQSGGKRYPFNKNYSSQPSRAMHGIQMEPSYEEAQDVPLYDAPSSLSSLTMFGRIKAPLCQGTVNGRDITIVLDTGAEGIFVDRRLVPDCDMTDKTVGIRLAEGKPVQRRCCYIRIECPYYDGKAPAIALEDPAMPMYLGRVKNLAPNFKCEAYDQAIREWDQRSDSPEDEEVLETAQQEEDQVPTDSAVMPVCGPVSTRATDRDHPQPPVPADVPLEPLCNREEFRREQEGCSSLKKWFIHARRQDTVTSRGGRVVQYYLKDGLLYQSATTNGHQEDHLCIPTRLRRTVMYMAHHNPLSGHRGPSKTIERIRRYFVWPGMTTEIQRYVSSCHECQLTSHAATPKAPMGITKLSAEPFARVAVDIVGPLEPASSSGKRFILTYVDMATRYPDAVALSSMESATVAQALFEICSRVGFPEALTSDNGTNFTSKMFESFLRLLQCQHIRTSVYHAQSNGVCERYNGTLKRCLRKLTADFPRQWDRFLPAALFTYRDTPHETTGYSPFELIYGHRVRGPLEFLQECWQSDTISEEDRDVHQYILKFAANLKTACQTALKSLQTQQQKSKSLFDRHARRRLLRPGDKVLLLLPTDMKKLLLRWKGPYTVTRRFDADHYAVQIGERERRYHINQLKLYKDEPEAHRDPALALQTVPPSTPEEAEPPDRTPTLSATPLMLHYGAPEVPLSPSNEENEEADALADWQAWFGEEASLHLATALAVEEAHTPVDDERDPTIPTTGTETYSNVVLGDELSSMQTEELYRTLSNYQDVLSDVPGKTDVLEHDIRLLDSTPFRHSYVMPHHLSKQLKADLQTWLELGIVEKSDSPFCSPLLAVRKKDGSHRFCLDCRRLNARTVFDGEPIADPALIFTQLSKARFLSKMDLASGFWQVPLSDQAKPYTAFSTRHGLYQFKVMPFGLVNAPGCFSRLMRIVLDGIENVSCYIDDILIHAPDWKSYMAALKAVLQRLRKYGLHLKPSKCELGFSSLQYLGHIVGQGQMAPVEDKVRAIQELEKPGNVTQMRSFLGSVGYYQRFIPHFNTIAQPLHQLVSGKVSKSTPLQWTDEAEVAFAKLKEALAGRPVLQLIDPEMPFILQTDASEEGVGAVLLQVRSGDARELAPVMYASRRLKPAERNYSTIEKEALAIYWAFKKFEVYLYGRQFTLQTDHRPLLHLQSADKLNPRLKRWAIYLNLFSFRAEHIEGSNNHMADLLSRKPLPYNEKK